MDLPDEPCRVCGGSSWILETVIDIAAGSVDSRELACTRCTTPEPTSRQLTTPPCVAAPRTADGDQTADQTAVVRLHGAGMAMSFDIAVRVAAAGTPR